MGNENFTFNANRQKYFFCELKFFFLLVMPLLNQSWIRKHSLSILFLYVAVGLSLFFLCLSFHPCSFWGSSCIFFPLPQGRHFFPRKWNESIITFTLPSLSLFIFSFWTSCFFPPCLFQLRIKCCKRAVSMQWYECPGKLFCHIGYLLLHQLDQWFSSGVPWDNVRDAASITFLIFRPLLASRGTNK